VREEILQTLEAVKQVCNRDPHDDPEASGAIVRQVADALKLDRTAAYRRLRAAEYLELVVNLETREKRPGRYRATGQNLIAVTDLLPAADALRQAYQEAMDAMRARQRTAAQTGPKPAQQRNRRG
jgi:hypothetical protein